MTTEVVEVVSGRQTQIVQLGSAYVDAYLAPFATRAALVSWAATVSPSVGQVARAGGYSYRYTGSGTAISDMPGWVPDAADRYPAECFGFSTTNTEAQNRTALRAALNYGPASVGAGAWPLAYFVHKTGDDLLCHGADCVFVSASGPVFIYGPIKGNSFNTSSGSARILLNTVVRGDLTITTTTAGDAAGFAVGDIVPIYCDLGYSDGEGHFKSAFTQITEVISVNSTTGVIGLRDAIYKDAPSGAQMLISAPATIVNSELTSAGVAHYGLTKGVKAGNFSVTTNYADSWTRFGGTYRSDIGPVWVDKSKGGFVNNGFAYSNINIPQCLISEHVLDLAMFSHNSSVVVGQFSDDVGQSNIGATAFSLAEGAHHNKVDMGSGSLTRDQQRASVLWCVDGTEENIITAGNILAVNVATVLRHNITRALSSSKMPVATNRILSGIFTAKTCDSLIWLNATSAGDSIPAYIGRDVKLIGTPGTATILANSVDWTIEAEFVSTVAVTMQTGATRNKLLAKFPSYPTITLATGCYLDTTKVRLNTATIDQMAGQIGIGSAIQSTTFVSRYNKTIPAGLVTEDDSLEFEVFGLLSGTAGAKRCRVRLNTTTTAEIFFAFGVTGAFYARGAVTFIAAGSQRIFMVGSSTGVAPQVIRTSGSLNEATTDIQVEVGGLVDNVADGIALEHVSVTVRHAQ